MLKKPKNHYLYVRKNHHKMTHSPPSLPLHQALDVISTKPIELSNSGMKFSGAKIDSRHIVKGDIFIALKGENSDGHEFIEDAIERGAVAVVVNDSFVTDKQFFVPIIKVSCTQTAFGQLAHLWRTSLFAGKVIAITGSNGKTTIKNMIKSVLQTRYKTACTAGNYNNELGVPITIFTLPLDCDFWVLEMGARHLGDIDYLCRIAMPDITLVSNIGDAHIGEFGNKEKQVQAKAEILAYGEMAILDVNSPYYRQFKKVCEKSHKSEIKLISQDAKKATQAAHISWGFIDEEAVFYTKNESFRLKLNCLGEHNAHNAAWAVAIADYCHLRGDDIVAGLRAVQPEQGRLQTIKCQHYTIINDSYNASPESVEALLKITQSLFGKTIIVWGDMAELGSEEQMRQWHEKIAEKFNQYAIDWVLTYGDYARLTSVYGASLESKTQYQHAHNFTHLKQLIEQIIKQWQQDNSNNKTPKYVYLKAANKMNFSQLATLLSDE